MIRAHLSKGLALALLATLPGAAGGALGAPPAGATTSSASHATFPAPASARVHGANAATTSTPTPATTSTPATTAAGTSTAGATPGTAGATPGTAPATTVPTVPVRPAVGTLPATAHHTKAGSKRLSTGAIVAAVLAALLILVCLAWGAARWFAYEPRWLISLRHSLAEAGWRLSASWDEFSDWARIGR